LLSAGELFLPVGCVSRGMQTQIVMSTCSIFSLIFRIFCICWSHYYYYYYHYYYY